MIGVVRLIELVRVNEVVREEIWVVLIVVPGSLNLVPGYRSLVPGSLGLVLGSLGWVPGSLCRVPKFSH